MHQLQRLAPPQTPHTQMLKAQIEQQNMQMMENLSQQNQKQIQDLSAQLQSGLQQFLSSSMEQMFKGFSSQMAPTDTRASSPPAQAQPSQVVETEPTGSTVNPRTNGYLYSTGSVC